MNHHFPYFGRPLCPSTAIIPIIGTWLSMINQWLKWQTKLGRLRVIVMERERKKYLGTVWNRENVGTYFFNSFFFQFIILI